MYRFLMFKTSKSNLRGRGVLLLVVTNSKTIQKSNILALQERNVDVEHRFPDQLGNRSKKKSTRCRMIFRTTITHDNGNTETLQVCSQPIVCSKYLFFFNLVVDLDELIDLHSPQQPVVTCYKTS